MDRLSCALVLFLTCLVWARQPGPPHADTPPAIPQEQTSEHTMSLMRAMQSPAELTTPEVRQLIQDGLRSEPALAEASVLVRTDDRAIVLTGSVGSKEQHNIALQIVGAYAGSRQIVDRIKVNSAE